MLRDWVGDKPQRYEILFVARELVSRPSSGSCGIYHCLMLHTWVGDKPRRYEILFVARELVSRPSSGSGGVYPRLILLPDMSPIYLNEVKIVPLPA